MSYTEERHKQQGHWPGEAGPILKAWCEYQEARKALPAIDGDPAFAGNTSEPVILRAALAGCTVEEAAAFLQDCAPAECFDGTVTPQVGFGQWGVEAGALVESCTVHVENFASAIAQLLSEFGQTCAYVTQTKQSGEVTAWELTSTSEFRVQPIEGFRGDGS